MAPRPSQQLSVQTVERLMAFWNSGFRPITRSMSLACETPRFSFRRLSSSQRTACIWLLAAFLWHSESGARTKGSTALPSHREAQAGARLVWPKTRNTFEQWWCELVTFWQCEWLLTFPEIAVASFVKLASWQLVAFWWFFLSFRPVGLATQQAGG